MKGKESKIPISKLEVQKRSIAIDFYYDRESFLHNDRVAQNTIGWARIRYNKETNDTKKRKLKEWHTACLILIIWLPLWLIESLSFTDNKNLAFCLINAYKGNTFHYSSTSTNIKFINYDKKIYKKLQLDFYNEMNAVLIKNFVVLLKSLIKHTYIKKIKKE